jgi:hypothetical protein
VLTMPTGFSTQTRATYRWYTSSQRTKSKARALSSSLPGHHRAPLLASAVQGGCAINKSHGPNSATATLTSNTKCRASPSSAPSRSHDQHSTPRAANARRTTPLVSHPTNTRATPILTRRPYVLSHGLNALQLERGAEHLLPLGVQLNPYKMVYVAPQLAQHHLV